MPGFLLSLKSQLKPSAVKKLFLTAIFATFVSLTFGQGISLKIGTKATYQMTESGKKFSLTLVDTKTIDDPIDLNNQLFKDAVDSNVMKIAFVKSKMGDRPAIFLIIKTGKPGMIKYSAKIKYAGRSKFVNTDVNMIIGKVKTMEMWQDDISDILLGNFEEGSY